jgi:predicted short-subunit dehydrogenase-like oxidoreductase (DUF2520 family)
VLDSKEIKSVSIIGAGNVGWHLAIALHQVGIKIINIVSRTNDKATELAEKVSARPVILNQDHLFPLPDLIVVCVSDNAIKDVVNSSQFSESMIVHTSGSTGIDVFKGLQKQYGVLYPLQSFTLRAEMQYNNLPFLVEGSSAGTTKKLIKLASKISDTVFEADSEIRRRIHVAAVFACNFSNHLAAISGELLKEVGMPFSLLFPLIDETHNKVRRMNPIDAQTGPAVRNDFKTIESHIKSLEGKKPEMELYKLLSDNIIRYRNLKNE